MNDERLEQLLCNAPAPAMSAHFAERLETIFDQPQEAVTDRRPKRFKIHYLIPAASAAALLAVLAVVLFSPSPVAYSFEKTVGALRNVRSVTVVHKVRSGPPQPLPSSAGGEGTTTWHPANPFAEVEVRRQVVNGRESSRMLGRGVEVVRNGPLGLAINQKTGERTFFLDGLTGSPEGLVAPEEWLVELEEQAARGDVRFEIKEKVDSEGNFEVVIRDQNLEPGQFMRLFVNEATWLPVRLQVLSTEFPEYGAEVVMQELVLQDFNAEFDDGEFAIVPTDAELAKLGLDRAALAELPLTATAIEIGGESGRRVSGVVMEGDTLREVAGVLPFVLVEAPEGEMFIDLRTDDGERSAFDIRVGAMRLMTESERMVVYATERGVGVTAVPLDVEDAVALIKRSREW